MSSGAISLLFSCGFRAKLKVIGLRAIFCLQIPILRVRVHAKVSGRMPWAFGGNRRRLALNLFCCWGWGWGVRVFLLRLCLLKLPSLPMQAALPWPADGAARCSASQCPAVCPTSVSGVKSKSMGPCVLVHPLKTALACVCGLVLFASPF